MPRQVFSLSVSSVSLSNALRFVFDGGKMLYIMGKKERAIVLVSRKNIIKGTFVQSVHCNYL